MTNARSKGKRNELFFVNELKEIFPDCHRNWKTQTAIGGVDISNTGCIDFECKSGSKYTLATIKDAIDQVEEEGNEENYNVILVKPDKKRGKGKNKFEPYVIIPFDDFKQILKIMKAEGII